MRRIACLSGRLALALLFAGGLWLRVTSLESMPFPDGDEAWYGVQAGRWNAGGAVEWQTPTGNHPSPFNAGLQALLLRFHHPSLWLLRLPAVISGLLAVVLMYRLGTRMFDRPTALIASGMLAALPVAILFSRIGYDISQTPLFSLLAVYAAHRGRAVGLLVAIVALVWTHPVNVFLLPALQVVFLERVWRRTAGDPARRCRELTLAVVVPMVLAVGFGLSKLRLWGVHGSVPTILHEHNWAEFATLYGRMLLAMATFGRSEWNIFAHDWGFRIACLGLLTAGGWRLVRARRWDVLALLGGLLVSLAAFHLIGGRDAIRTTWWAYLRYGLFAAVPTVLVLACLARGLLVEPTTPRRALARSLQHAALLAVGWGMLLSVKANWFDNFAVAGYESLWTARTDAMDPFRQATTVLLRDIDRAPKKPHPMGRAVVLASSGWAQWPIEYLALPRGDIHFVTVMNLARSSEEIRQLLEGPLRAGAYVVDFPRQGLEEAVTALFPPGAVRRWDVPFYGATSLVIFRLKRPDELVGPPTVTATGPAPAVRR